MPISLIAAGIVFSNLFGHSVMKWRARKPALLVLAAYVIFTVTPVGKFALLAIAPQSVTINLERLTILGLAAVLLALLLESRASSGLSHAIISSTLVLQILFASMFTPHLRAVVLAVIPSNPLARIGMSFHELDQTPFTQAKDVVGRGMVLAIGIPSFRLNLVGIDTLGGYSSLYPQSHKDTFGRIVSDALIDDPSRDYFWNWGSRAELDQVSESRYCAIDFSAAREAGVSFIASKTPLRCATGIPLIESEGLVLYAADSFP